MALVTDTHLESSRCLRCGRPLKDPLSRARGMGPVCVARERADREMAALPPGSPVVTVNGRHLSHVVRHSPTGMEWGYGGSGPADLARTILLDYLSRCGRELKVHGVEGAIGKRGRERVVDQLYQGFKWAVVARFPHEGWKLTGEEIAAWLMQTGMFDAVPALPVVYEGRRT